MLEERYLHASREAWRHNWGDGNERWYKNGSMPKLLEKQFLWNNMTYIIDFPYGRKQDNNFTNFIRNLCISPFNNCLLFSSVPTRHLANFFVEKAEDIIDIGQTLIVKVNSVYIIFCPSISHKNVNFLNLYEESLLYWRWNFHLTLRPCPSGGRLIGR